jgi:hypothetical protein
MLHLHYSRHLVRRQIRHCSCRSIFKVQHSRCINWHLYDEMVDQAVIPISESEDSPQQCRSFCVPSVESTKPDILGIQICPSVSCPCLHCGYTEKSNSSTLYSVLCDVIWPYRSSGLLPIYYCESETRMVVAPQSSDHVRSALYLHVLCAAVDIKTTINGREEAGTPEGPTWI